MALTMEQLNAIYEDALFSNTPPVNFKNMSVYENSVAPMEVNVPSGLQTIDIEQAPVKSVTQSNGLDYLLNQGGEQNQNLTVEEYNNLIANQNAEPTDNFLTRALSGIADNKYVQNAKNITGMITQPLIGGIGFLASKMDKFSSLPYVDQQYVKENMVYKDPSSGLYKDPYGINVRSLGLLSDTDGSYGQYQVKEAEKLGENITKRAKEKYGVDFNVNEFLEKGDAYLETLSGKKVDKFKTLNKLNLEKLNFYGKGSAAFINQKDNYETAQKIKEADRKIRKAAAQQEIIRKAAAAASRAESRRQYNPDVHGPNNYGLGSDGKQSFDTGQGFGSNATTGGPVSNRSGRGRTDFAFGGTGGRTSSSSDQGNKGGGGDRPSARERYLASLYSSKPITKTKTIAPPGEQGGQGYIAPTSKTRTVTTGGGSPFSYTKPPKTLSGITSNYINPTFRKATIDFLTRRQLANQPKSFLENLTSIYGDDVTTVASYGKDTKVEEAQARIEAGVAMPGDVDLVNAATNKITSVPDLSNPDVLNKIAIDTGMPTVKEGIYGMRKDVATPQTARDIKSIQNYKRNTDVDLRMSVPEIMRFDIGERLGQPQIQSIYDMVKVPGQTPFMAAQGGRVGYGTGGIVTL